MRKLNIWFWGVLALTGAAIQIVTSLIWQHYPQAFNGHITLGEWIYMSGQGVGELCYLICILHFMNVKKALWCIMGFIVDLSIIDCISIIFFNPFELSISKTIGVIFAFIILLIRLYSYDKRHQLH